MSWGIISEPVALCQWHPWSSAGLSHGMIGQPFDFRAATRGEALMQLATISAWQPQPSIRWLRQTHSTILWGLGLPESAGVRPYVEDAEGDGFIFRRGVVAGSVAITTADCLSIIILGGEFGALVHAGWRGLAEGIVTEAATKVSELSGVSVEVAVFPHASLPKYEVGEEVLSAFPIRHTRAVRNNEGHHFLDLSATAEAMVTSANIPVAAWHHAAKDIIGCTITHSSWHSHRREGQVSGRNATFVAIS